VASRQPKGLFGVGDLPACRGAFPGTALGFWNERGDDRTGTSRRGWSWGCGVGTGRQHYPSPVRVAAMLFCWKVYERSPQEEVATVADHNWAGGRRSPAGGKDHASLMTERGN
jgi:hypothetical protein